MTVDLAALTDADAHDVVDSILAASDEELLAALAGDDVRGEAFRSLLSRLHEYAVPERLAGVRGDVRIELVRRDRVLEAETIRIADGAVVLLEQPQGAPDVVLRTSLLRFVWIVSGERNAGLEYLRVALDIEGDADLALAVGGIFVVPGSHGVAVDPRDLDPVQVAAALGEVKGDHLKQVMRSGFRDVVLSEIFRRLPDFVNPRKAAKVRLTVGFRLTGNPSGEVERYVVTIDHGTATVTQGDGDAGERDATVTCEGHDFLKLATGHLNPVFGVLRGHLKVKGDQGKALQLNSVIDIPQA